jgi:hypothetical protein
MLPAVKDGTDFFTPMSAQRLREQIQAVLNQEAPLHEDLLARRILDAWGLSKLTPRVRQRIDEQTGELAKRGIVLIQGEFLWSSTCSPSQYTGFRGAHAEREAAQLPPEEVANAAESVLSQALSLGREDLLRETGRLIGIQRLTRSVLPVLEAGLELLTRRGRCTTEGDRAMWRE